MQDTKTPFLINCGAVVLNTAINVPMFAWFGVQGLAAGHALAYIFGVSIQARVLSRRIGGLDGAAILSSVGRISVASLGMGLVVWLTARATVDALGTEGVANQALGLAIPVGVGVIAYGGLALLLRVREVSMVTDLLGRRFRPDRGSR
jgi:putative peptidoglycan lipid II flippase